MNKIILTIIILSVFLNNRCTTNYFKETKINNQFVLLSGELSSNSILLQCRLTKSDTLINNDIPGIEGVSCFQISTDSLFSDVIETNWMESTVQNDYIIKTKIDGLNAGTRYFYRVKADLNNSSDTMYSQTGTFKTFPDSNNKGEVSFAMSTGFNYESFYGIEKRMSTKPQLTPATGVDRKLGFEAFDAVKNLKVDFFIANGDVVYYDKPNSQPEIWAKTKQQLNAKWHRYFSMPRNRQMCLQIPVYYLKDDHDYRFNDSDTTNQKSSEPSHQLGIDVFRNQVPVTDPADSKSKTYRTHRAGKHLQLWFLEGRDYRSPNTMTDTAQKTIWGKEQKEWLKRTLRESNATFKIIVSPTPMIGPDDAYKKDNHTNPGGFQTEGKAFLNWLTENSFTEKNLYFICGDRHWQYHSIHPTGFEEFSGGSFVNQNSRPGRLPGDPGSTDPDAVLSVPYIQTDHWGGGFLYIKTSIEDKKPTAIFSFRDITGKELYTVKREGK